MLLFSACRSCHCTIFCHPNVDRCRSIRCTASGNRTKYGHSYRKLAAVFPRSREPNQRGILGKRDGKIVIVGRVVRVSWRHEDNAISGAEIGSLIRSDAQSVTKSFFGHGNGCNDKIASGRDIDVLTFDRKPREKELVIRGIAERSEIACVNGVDRNGTVSVALSENASTTMQARVRSRNAAEKYYLSCLHCGRGISATYSRLLKMSASSGIYFLSPNERSAGTISTIQLLSCEMDLDAPDILIDRKVQIGQIILGTDHPSSLNIGRDPQSGVLTKNVFFTKEVDVEAKSSLNLTSAQTAVFQGHLNLIRDAQADIRSRQIEIEKLFLGNVGSHARFRVDSDGHMVVHEPVSVSSTSGLTIDLGERSTLSAAVDTHEGGGSRVTIHRDSYWFVPEDSNLSLVNVEPSSYIQLGQQGHPSQMETETLKGNGAVFYLTAGSTGSLNISKSSEGKHAFLLGSSGVSLANTGYLYHIAVNDDSPNSLDKATFSLANDGIIDAGPYMYKLGLYPFKKGDSRVWAILGTQSLKPVLPDNPETPTDPSEPPDEVIPKPDLPELPFDPTNPPELDDSAEKPIGLSPAAKLTLASAASGNQIIQFLGSLDDLRSRMGEVREGAEDGSYILYRYDKSRFESHYSANSTFKYSAFTIGADRKFSSGWVLGANLLLTRGNIHVDDAPGNHSRVESVGAKFLLRGSETKDNILTRSYP